jgi:predicted Ser/Thr protein kinase
MLDPASLGAGPTYVGHGQRGTVSVARERCPRTQAERLIATKRRRDGAPSHTIGREAEFMAIVNRHGIGPRLVALAEDGESVRYEYVRGLPVLDHIQQPSVDKDAVLDILKQVFAQLLCLDRLRLNKHEMTWPAEHILIEATSAEGGCDAAEAEGAAAARLGNHSAWRPVLIDFERCTAAAAKPRNVTQFLQFLTTPTVVELLRQKRVAVDVPRLRSFGSQYKERLAALETSSATVATPGAAPEAESGTELEGGAKWEWDFVGDLGLRDEPVEMREEAGGAAAAEPTKGRAARKLEAKRMRASADAAAAETQAALASTSSRSSETSTAQPKMAMR